MNEEINLLFLLKTAAMHNLMIYLLDTIKLNLVIPDGTGPTCNQELIRRNHRLGQ